MLYQITQPSGIDYWVQLLQTDLHAHLLALYGISTTTYSCYGRIHRNWSDNGYMPQAYISPNEYKTIQFDDTKNLVSFFGVPDATVKNGVSTSNVHLVFFANLTTLMGTNNYRLDEKFKNDITNFCNRKYGFSVIDWKTGVDKVLTEYSSSKKDALKWANMQPWYVFRCDMKIMYNANVDYRNSLATKGGIFKQP